MNTLNSKINESNRFMYQFTDKLNFKNPNKNMALANLSIYSTWKNIKSEYNENKFKTYAPTWTDKFDLPDGSYFISDIQGYFECITKKHEAIADNPPKKIYVIKNRIAFKIKTGYKLELLSEETMQILGSLKNDIDKNEDEDLIPRLETVEVVLVHCSLLNNSYQTATTVLFSFLPDKKL